MIMIRVPLITIGNKLNVYKRNKMPLSNIKTFNSNWGSNDKLKILKSIAITNNFFFNTVAVLDFCALSFDTNF